MQVCIFAFVTFNSYITHNHNIVWTNLVKVMVMVLHLTFMCLHMLCKNKAQGISPWYFFKSDEYESYSFT